MPQDSEAISNLRSRPQSLKWLARYAVWGMPLAYLILVGLTAMAVMLLVELITLPLLFVLPREHWSWAAGVVVFAAFGVHILVGILGSHRLQAVAERFPW